MGSVGKHSKGEAEMSTKIIFHRDGTITYWSVYQQIKVRSDAKHIPDRELAAMRQKERERVILMREDPEE